MRVGLIGDPVGHSKSPAMQDAAFAAVGIAARYELWLTHAAELPERIASLRMPEVLGANVTIPHKRAVLPLVDDLAEDALATGAVNTIVPRQGRLIGENTDVAGLVAALAEIGWQGMEQAVILGAGGAARAAAVALARLGAEAICVMARSVQAAQDLTAAVAPAARHASLLWGDLTATDPHIWRRMLATTDIILNATPVGMAHLPGLPLDEVVLDLIAPGTLIVDCITHDTPLIQAARARDLPAMNGLPMLLHQGAAAFTLWTNRPAPLDVMRAALLGL
jgi:shikimate dehydrogenase